MKIQRWAMILLTVCMIGGAAWRFGTRPGQAQENRAPERGRILRGYEETNAEQERPQWVEDVVARSAAYLKQAPENFQLLAAWQDDLGQTHARFAQTHRGLPVFGVQVVTHADAKGMRLSGRPFEDRDLDITPILTPAQAIEAAQSAVRHLGEFGPAAEPALVALPHVIFDRDDQAGATLAWQVELPGPNGAVRRTFIDARTGRLVWHYNHTPAENREAGAAELIQAGESGALASSFADIREALRMEGSDGIRRMAAPAIDHYSKLVGGSNCEPTSGNENCWARENGGISNKAFYLLAEGGVHPVSEITVAGIGRDKAGMVFARSLRALSPNAQFADAREEAMRAATELFGKGSREQISTEDAWRAVGMASSACSVMISPGSKTFSQEGGQTTITVMPGSADCAWTATTTDSWIKIVSGSSGVGNGIVTLSVSPNDANFAKYGEVKINGLIFSVHLYLNSFTVTNISVGQTINGELSKSDRYVAGLPERYSVGGDEQPIRYVDVYNFFGAAGQPISISMNSSVVDSYLKLQRDLGPNVTIATGDDYRGTLNARIPATGNFVLPETGRYAILVTTAPKAGPSRTGSYSLTLASPCTYSLSSASAAFWSAGGTGTFNVATVSTCGWNARSNVSWITVQNYADIFATAGNGSVTYTVAPNPNAAGRSGTITVAGQTFTVIQQGAN